MGIEKNKPKMEEFLKEAFCITGECHFVKMIRIDNMPTCVYKLTDERRGEFFVSISKKLD